MKGPGPAAFSQSWSNSCIVFLQLRKHLLTVEIAVPQSLKDSGSLLPSPPLLPSPKFTSSLILVA